MKIPLHLVLAAAFSCLALAPAHAQTVANGDFETWAVRNGNDSPTGWLTTDDVAMSLLPIPLATGTFTKTTDAHSGTYAVRLETKTTLLGVLPGAVGIGTKVGADITVPGGVPFTTRPAQLQFYYKLSGPQPATASNGAFAQVALTRTTNGSIQVIATAKQVLTTVTSTYVLAQVPLTYTSSASPDSLRLVFSSGIISLSAGATATAGTVLQVDDVAFTGTVTATRDAALSAALTVSPNPSPDGRYVLAAPPTLLSAPLAVLDATGRVVWREDARSQLAATRALDLKGLASGLYTLQVFANQGLLTKKLLVP